MDLVVGFDPFDLIIDDDEDEVDFVRRERVYRDRHHPLEEFTDDQEFIACYRFPRAKILEIIQLVAVDIEQPTKRSMSIPSALQECIALKFYAFGSYFKDLCELYHVDKATISRSISRVTTALCRRAQQFIQFPTAVDDIIPVKRSFANINDRLPNVIGAVDGTHIRLTLLHRDEEALFVNRHQYHSINAQIICDGDLIIMNVVAQFPGRTHDSYILRKSSIFPMGENGALTGYMLGDSAYPAKPWLLTPVLSPNTDGERRYNVTQKRLQNTVERTIGLCKARFRCLEGSTALRFRPTKCCHLIVAVAMLHNMARKASLPYDEPDMQDPEEDVIEQDDQAGRQMRLRVIERYFS